MCNRQLCSVHPLRSRRRTPGFARSFSISLVLNFRGEKQPTKLCYSTPSLLAFLSAIISKCNDDGNYSRQYFALLFLQPPIKVCPTVGCLIPPPGLAGSRREFTQSCKAITVDPADEIIDVREVRGTSLLFFWLRTPRFGTLGGRGLQLQYARFYNLLCSACERARFCNLGYL